MSSLSRTYARRSEREGTWMKQFQFPGAYEQAEVEYEKKLLQKRQKRRAAENKKARVLK